MSRELSIRHSVPFPPVDPAQRTVVEAEDDLMGVGRTDGEGVDVGVGGESVDGVRGGSTGSEVLNVDERRGGRKSAVVKDAKEEEERTKTRTIIS